MNTPLGAGAWGVLDHRVAIETGATVLAASGRARRTSTGSTRLVERMWVVDDFEIYRRADIRFHIGLAEAARLAAPGERDDRGSGSDERADHADRAPAGGADALERSAPPAGAAAGAARGGAVGEAHPEHMEGTEHISPGCFEGSERGGALDERAPVGVDGRPPPRVALRLEALARWGCGPRSRAWNATRRTRRRPAPPLRRRSRRAGHAGRSRRRRRLGAGAGLDRGSGRRRRAGSGPGRSPGSRRRCRRRARRCPRGPRGRCGPGGRSRSARRSPPARQASTTARRRPPARAAP